MLEYLKFRIGGMSGFTEFNVTIENGKINAYIENMFCLDYPRESQLSEKESGAWLETLENIHIERWKSVYIPSLVICDGESWELEYKRVDKRCRHISGDNAYPENWDEFIEVMDVISPLIYSKQVEKIDLTYNRKTKMAPPQKPDFPNGIITWDYYEKLTIDRATETITIKQNFGTDCVVMKEYYIQEGVCELLETLEYYFDEPVRIVPQEEDATATYDLEVTYHKHEPFRLQGAYNRHGLPEYWREFMEEMDFRSVGFCRLLSYKLGWKPMQSYRIPGKILPKQSIVLFDLTGAFPIKTVVCNSDKMLTP